MTDFLGPVPGPLFLLLFWGSWFVLHHWMRRFEDPSLPSGLGADPLSLAPRQVALLAQGREVALLTVVYELLEQGKLVWTEEAQAVLVASETAHSEDPLEAALLLCAKHPQGAQSLVDRALVASSRLLDQERNKLEAKGLLVSARAVRLAWGRLSIPLSVLGFLAVAKLRIGLEREKPILLLVLSLLLGGVIFLGLHRPWGKGRLSRKGKALLARARQHVQIQVLSGQPSSMHGEKMLALGVLGIAALATDPLAQGPQHLVWGERGHGFSPVAGEDDAGGEEAGGFSSTSWSFFGGVGGGSEDGGGSGDGGGGDSGGGGCGGCGGGGD